MTKFASACFAFNKFTISKYERLYLTYAHVGYSHVNIGNRPIQMLATKITVWLQIDVVLYAPANIFIYLKNVSKLWKIASGLEFKKQGGNW